MRKDVKPTASKNLTSENKALLAWDVQIRSQGTIGWDWLRWLRSKLKAIVRMFDDDT
jgi:hypothetical protein